MKGNVERQILDRERKVRSTPVAEVFSEAMNKRTRAVPNDLRLIDISILNPHVRELRELTSADPGHRERAKLVYLDPGHKLSFSEKIFVGTYDSVETSINPMLIEQYVFMMHSHGVADTPFSPMDLEELFYKPFIEGELVKGVPVGAMVITDSQTSLIMRGLNTPQWDPSEAERKTKEWTDEGKRRMDEAGSQTQASGAKESQAKFARYHAYAGYFREIVREYDLRWFSGSPDSEVLTLQSA